MPDTSPPGPTLVKNPVALLVDSSPELNQLLTEIFKQEKWEVWVAANNSEALELTKTRVFDLIITGEKTTGHGGYRFAATLAYGPPAYAADYSC